MDNLLIIFFTLLLSAFFSGMEIAFFSSNKLRIEIDRQKGLVPGNIFSKFLNKPSELIATLLIGNNIALVLFSMSLAKVTEPWLAGIFPFAGYRLALQTLMATGIVLVFGEFLPKMLFRVHPNGFLNAFAIPTVVFHYVFYPIATFFNYISKGIMYIVFKDHVMEERYSFSRLDLNNYLLELTGEGEEVAELEDEIQMIQNAMDFRSVKLRECMIPRTEIKSVEATEPIENLSGLFATTGHSKILVYDENIDNIVGYAHIFDLFKNPNSITEIIRPVLIVPESMLANKVMEKFIKERKSIGVVVDEFGGTAGIVTLEDIIEEIFGEIKDEFDTYDLYETQISKDEYIFEARIEIHYLNETYEFNIEESDEYSTLAGYILSHHENIPTTNEIIEIGNYRFTILEASETKLIRVKMKVLQK